MSTSEITSSPKMDAQRLLQNLPDDASWEDIEYAIYVVKRIRAGQESAERGECLSSEEVREQLAAWRK